MNKNKIIILSLVALVITIGVALILFPVIKLFTTDNFFNGSGYGFNGRFGKLNTIIPLNHVSKSTDFKLFSLLSQP